MRFLLGLALGRLVGRKKELGGWNFGPFRGTMLIILKAISWIFFFLLFFFLFWGGNLGDIEVVMLQGLLGSVLGFWFVGGRRV